MSSKKDRGKGGKRGGSQKGSSSQKFPTEYEEMFSSVDDLKKQRAGQLSDAAPQVHDSTAGTKDRQNSSRPKEGKKKKADSQQRERGHSDHQRPPGATYENPDQSQAKPAKSKERTSSAELKRNVQGGKDKIQTTCLKCFAHFNNTNIPMLLNCKHTICADCFDSLKKYEENRSPCCNSEINYKDTVVNYPLQEHIQQRVRKESDGEHHHGNSPVQQSGRSRTPPADTTMDYSPGPPGRASHNGKCIEFRKLPTAHCATCQQWVCDSCLELDHQRRECHLIPKKDALQEMKEAQVIGANEAVEGVQNALMKLHSYNEHLNALLSAMQLPSEYIAEEKKHVVRMIEKGKIREREIQTTLYEMQDNQSLPEALAFLQRIEKISVCSEQWTSAAESKNSLVESIPKALKEISICTLQIMKNEAQKNQTDLMISAVHNIAEQTLYSLVKLEGECLIVPCLDERQTVPHGIRAIPLLSLKASMDPSLALAYLEIGTESECFGRVVIRVMSDTTRGRQFLMMCTGEAGPSYHNNRFHRIWWQDKPAEHIWGGDYDKGDGSGGKPVLNLSEKESASLPAGKRMPIQAGLVAGSFEETKKVPSTIFRIYTKNDKKPRRDYSYSKDIEEADVDSAFGTVIEGLHVLDSVTKNYPVNDIIIISCGIIIKLK